MANEFDFLASSGYGNQIRGYPQATSLQPTDAFLIDRLGVGSMFIEAQDLYIGGPYDIAMNYSSVPPPSQVFLSFIAARDFSLPLNMAGSQAEFVNPPSSALVLAVQKNGVQYGTISFGAGNTGVGTFAGPAQTFVIGDLLEIATPSATFGAQNLALTFAGIRDA